MTVLSKERLQAGRDHVNAMFASTGSSITDQSSTFPSFTLQQLTLGKVLGKGGFGTVSEVRAFAVLGDTTEPASDEASSQASDDGKHGDVMYQMESRRFIAKHCLRESSRGGKGGGGSGGAGGDARYAIKELSVETKKNDDLFLQGLIDMAVETRVLSDLEHPNIIKMRAICHTSDASPFSEPEKYFIVMDRLYDTLEKRLQTWKKQSDRLNSLRFVKDRSGSKNAALYEERIVAAFDLSAALSYLHDRQIIYRDLKPENIGFDIRNDVKIFDFGLAKELVMAKEKYADGTFKLTEMTGSPRYMAPEVALGKPYNEKCDVYSFAILLWEIITLDEPYQLLGMKALQTRVWQEDGEQKRPYIPDDSNKKHKHAHLWTAHMKLLLKRSWCPNIQTRNSMSQVYSILRKECVRARNGDDSGLEHCRRRSTYVFRPSPASSLNSNNMKKDGSIRRMGGALLQRMTSSKATTTKSAPARMMMTATTTTMASDIMKETTRPAPCPSPKAAPPQKTATFAMDIVDSDECSV